LFHLREDTTHLGVARIFRALIVILAHELASADAASQVAMVVYGAQVVVVARYLVERVDAADARVATVGRADVFVVTIQRPAGDALAAAAVVLLRARISVAARLVVGFVHAPDTVLAGIVGALVGVVAVQQDPRLTCSRGAVVPEGARVVVVADRQVGFVDAAGFHIARVVGAFIAVVAVQERSRSTLAPLAEVVHGANAAVGAGFAVQRVVLAPALGQTLVFCTRVFVVAVQNVALDAQAVLTVVVLSTVVSVAAHAVGIKVDAADLRDARVLCAHVAVVAVGRSCGHALSVRTVVAGRALVSVVADRLVGRVDAPDSLVARVVRAGIAVIAIKLLPGDAQAKCAEVIDGADIVVGARLAVRVVETACVRLARIVSTHLSIVAVHLGPCCTDAFRTTVPHRAQVPILAGESLVSRRKRAGPGQGVARRHEAGCVNTFRGGTLNQGLRIHDALVGKQLHVADERTVAQVPILERFALFIGQAVARNLKSHALALDALVADGAWIAVVTGIVVGRIVASAGLGAHVVGAGVFIVTDDRVAHAHSLDAVVRYGADVAVFALYPIQGHVLASGLAVADIFRTLVFIIAQVQVDTSLFDRLVYVSVAVVVHAVALLLDRYLGIARREALLFANPLPVADTPIAGNAARSPETQLYRLPCAGTDAGIGHALREDDPGHGRGLFAGEAPGAFLAFCAGPSAEAPLLAIVHAHIFGSDRALAIIAVRARPAQVRVVGNANRYEVRTGSGLLTGPAGRAFLQAELRAYGFPHVFHAPSGEAIPVLLAPIKEAALPGLAFHERVVSAGIKGNLRYRLFHRQVGGN